MNLEGELRRIFTDERLDLPVRRDAVEVPVAGARRIRRKRTALLAGVVVVSAPLLLGAGILAMALVGASDTDGRTTASPSAANSLPVGNRPSGPPTVAAAPEAAAHPLYATVRPVLQTYVDAINAKDYGMWLTTVSTKRMEGQSEQAWQQVLGTIRVAGMIVQRIDQENDRSATAIVTSVSVQDPEHAPSNASVQCMLWKVTFSLIVENDAWKIGWRPTDIVPNCVTQPPSGDRK